MRLLLACAAAALGGTGLRGPIDLRFHPAEGSSSIKTFRVESGGRVDAITWEGRDILGLLAFNGVEVESTLQVRDEHVRVADGRPLELLRDFDALETVWRWGRRSEVPHALLYRTVRFTWDESCGAYDKDWDPPRGSRKDLAEVWEDLDYRSLLPDEPVEVGATWSVPLARVAPVLMPGGPIHRDRLLWEAWSLFELEDALRHSSLHWYRNEDVSCRLAEVTRSGDRRLARVVLDWHWWGWVELVGPSEDEGWWQRLSTHSAVVELELDCKGELLWDLDSGTFSAFELEAEVDAELELLGSWGDIEIQAQGWARWTAEASYEP